MALGKPKKDPNQPYIVTHYAPDEVPKILPPAVNCLIRGPVRLLLGRAQGFILHVRSYAEDEPVTGEDIHVKQKSTVAEKAGYTPLCFVRDRQVAALHFPIAPGRVYDLAYIAESRLDHIGTYTMKSALRLCFPDERTYYEYEYKPRGQRWIDRSSDWAPSEDNAGNGGAIGIGDD